MESFDFRYKLTARLIKDTISKGCIDVQDMASRFTFDSICKIGFGLETNCIDSEEVHEFGRAFDRGQLNAMNRFLSPLPISIRRWIHPDEYSLMGDIKILNDVVYKVISERRSDVHLEEKLDILSKFMMMEVQYKL